MGKRDYTGGAQPLSLETAVGATDLTFDVFQVNGTWPLGSSDGLLPFFITIDRGLADEEKILCTHRVGNTFYVAPGGRGADDTTARTHQASAVVEHIWTATDARESNDHVNRNNGAHGLSTGDTFVGQAQLAAGLALKVAKAGDTMGGPLVLAADPALPLEPVTKQMRDADRLEVDTNLAAEVVARIDGDNALQAGLDAEEAARIAGDGSLQSQIDAEEAARIAADTTLQTNIDTEEAARIAADAAHVAAADPHPQYAPNEANQYVKGWVRSMSFNASGASAFTHGENSTPISVTVNVVQASDALDAVIVSPGNVDSTNINIRAIRMMAGTNYTGPLSAVHIQATFLAARPT